MTTETILKLADLNKRFYEDQGQSFNQTRQEAWPGWNQLIPLIQTTTAQFKILDVGCGNGRFCDFVLKAAGPLTRIEYLGLEQSQTLLEIAKHTPRSFTGATTCSWHTIDLVESLMENREICLEHFDLVVLFAVLHHIPSYRLREKLFSQVARHLKPNGKFVSTTWQFLDIPILKQKIVSPHQVHLDTDQLDQNDYILDWQKQTTGYRYCHYFSDDEVQELLKKSGLKLETSYLADGPESKANKYYVAVT